LPLFGEFNVANFAAAAGAACLAGASIDDVVDAGRLLTAPPGRMQFVRSSGYPLVVIDFAHTPDALAKVLAGVRRHTAGRIVCVFGCGGDRDRGKRPLMARVAEAGADRVWVTSDNPRSEDAAAIAAEIATGFQHRVVSWLEGLGDADPRQVDLSAEAITVPAAAGDLVIWRQELPHGPSPNRTDRPRMAQYINMYSPAAQVNPVWR